MTIRHNQSRNQFEAGEGSELSLLSYRLMDGRMTIFHTEVPPALRGQGVAQELTRSALNWAESEGHKVVPTCSYVAAFIRRHSEFQQLLA